MQGGAFLAEFRTFRDADVRDRTMEMCPGGTRFTGGGPLIFSLKFRGGPSIFSHEFRGGPKIFSLEIRGGPWIFSPTCSKMPHFGDP